MTRREHLRRTVKNIKNQFVGEPVRRRQFLAAFYNHYISKNLKLPVFIRFPKAQFKYQNVTLETRPNTIDFWATLESYEPDLTQFLTEFLNGEKGTFVDVGAHIGRFSTLMSKQGWKVISFEPLKTNFKALETESVRRMVFMKMRRFLMPASAIRPTMRPSTSIVLNLAKRQ